jgi:phage gp29-like protein
MKRLRRKRYATCITHNTAVDYSEDTSIFEAVATRERSIDYTSLLYYLPNPDPVLKKLGRDIEVYEELKRDSEVSAAIGQYKDGVMSLEWDIDRGRSKSRQAKIIQQIMNDMDSRDGRGGITRIIGEILDARLFGYQPMEVMWEKVGTMIVPTGLIGKPQHWFNFNADNQLMFRQRGSIEGIPVPEMKFIVPTYEGKYDNPYGRGVLSSCFWPVTFKKGGLKFLVTFVEKYGMPYIVGHHKFTKQDDVDAFLGQLDNMVADGVIAIAKESQNVEVHQTGASMSSDIFERLVRVMDSQIDLAILNHASSTVQTPGSLGNQEGTNAVRQSVINAGKALVQQVFDVLIKWTYELNGMSGEIPRFVFFEEEDVDLPKAQRDSTLATAGVKFTKAYFMKAYGFDEEDIDVAAALTSAPPQNFAEDDTPVDQAIVDEIGDLIANPEDANALGKDLVARVVSYIEDASTYEEALSGLAALYPNVRSKDLDKTLTKVIAAALTAGRLNAAN